MPVRHARRAGHAGHAGHVTLAVGAAVVALLTGACKPPGTSADSTTADTPTPTETKAVSNGLANKSAREALAAVGTALRGAKSVHMKGSTLDSGDVVAIDMTLAPNGGKGQVRGPIDGHTVSMQLTATGNRVYVRSPQLWQMAGGQAAAQRIGNRWVVIPQTGAPDAAFLSLTAFAKEVLKPKGRVVKGKSATIAGQPVFSLIDSGDRSVLYVAATGKPYPLRMTDAGGKHHVDFADYDAPVTIAAPPNALDYRAVAGG
jgi:hypothetical protein